MIRRARCSSGTARPSCRGGPGRGRRARSAAARPAGPPPGPPSGPRPGRTSARRRRRRPPDRRTGRSRPRFLADVDGRTAWRGRGRHGYLRRADGSSRRPASSPGVAEGRPADTVCNRVPTRVGEGSVPRAPGGRPCPSAVRSPVSSCGPESLGAGALGVLGGLVPRARGPGRGRSRRRRWPPARRRASRRESAPDRPPDDARGRRPGRRPGPSVPCSSWPGSRRWPAAASPPSSSAAVLGTWLVVRARAPGPARRAAPGARCPRPRTGTGVLLLPVPPPGSPVPAGDAVAGLDAVDHGPGPGVAGHHGGPRPAGSARRSGEALVRRREETLDELERRDPDGFARWLAVGPDGRQRPGRLRPRPADGGRRPGADTDAA